MSISLLINLCHILSNFKFGKFNLVIGKINTGILSYLTDIMVRSFRKIFFKYEFLLNENMETNTKDKEKLKSQKYTKCNGDINFI